MIILKCYSKKFLSNSEENSELDKDKPISYNPFALQTL